MYVPSCLFWGEEYLPCEGNSIRGKESCLWIAFADFIYNFVIWFWFPIIEKWFAFAYFAKAWGEYAQQREDRKLNRIDLRKFRWNYGNSIVASTSFFLPTVVLSKELWQQTRQPLHPRRKLLFTRFQVIDKRGWRWESRVFSGCECWKPQRNVINS